MPLYFKITLKSDKTNWKKRFMLGMVHGTVGSVQFNLALVNMPVQVVRNVQYYLPIEAVLVHEKGWGTFSSVIRVVEVQ